MSSPHEDKERRLSELEDAVAVHSSVLRWLLAEVRLADVAVEKQHLAAAEASLAALRAADDEDGVAQLTSVVGQIKHRIEFLGG
jgi:hypothetical protein